VITLALVVFLMLLRVFLISPHPVDAPVEVVATALASCFMLWLLRFREKEKAAYQRAISRLETINVITTSLTESFDLQQTLDDILDRGLEVLGLRTGAVYLLDKEE